MTTDQQHAQNEIENLNTELTRFNATEAGLLELRDKYEGRVYDCDDPAGMKAAKMARRDIQQPRFNVEKLRKAAKAPILALGRAVDGRAKELTKQLLALEVPIDEQIKIVENRERKRLKDIEERINELTGIIGVLERYNPDAARLEEYIADYDSITVSHDAFQERYEEAVELKAATLATLKRIHAEKVQAEADAAELAELRREKAAREEADRKEAERKQAVAAAAQAAVDEGQGNGSKGDAGSIFDDEPQPDPFDDLPDAFDDLQASGGLPEAQLKYPGVNEIENLIAREFGIGTAEARVWICKAADEIGPPF